MGLPLDYYDLIDLLPQPGCAVCTLLRRHAVRAVESLVAEFALDVPLNTAFRRARGLCNPHSWLLAEMRGGALGTAILQEAVLHEVLSLMGQTTRAPASALARLLGGGGGPGAGLATRLEPEGPCLVCEKITAAEARHIGTLAAHLGEADLQAAYRASQGFCLPHFRHLLRETRNPDTLKLVLEIQTAAWSRLRDELNEFRRKYDAHYANEAMGAEGTSWQRAIEQVAGGRGALPWPTRR